MTDYLLVLSGDRALQRPCPESQLTLGRAPACDLVLLDDGVAARHALIRWQQGRLIIEALEGELRVGGRVVTACELTPGLQIALGRARVQRVHESGELKFRVTKTAAEVSFDTLSQADPQRAVHYQRRFELLLEMARTVGSASGAEEVEKKLMDLMHRALRPERAVLARLEPEGARGAGQIRFEAARSAGAEDPWRDLQVSGTVLRRVFESRKAFIAADAGTALPLSQARSIATQGIRSAICVPFLWPGQVAGALYADRRGDASYFDEDDLDFLLVLGQLATVALQNVRDYELVNEEVRGLRAQSGETSSLVGESPAIQKVREMVARVAGSDQPVLVFGERGTGKELVARAIHALSGRGAFVAVNCAAIPEALAESAFFGHERGAFTGAERAHRGYFEQAQGGTLFLDEIGDLRLGAQAAILRTLQEGEVRRVGSLEPIAINVRVVAATHRDLEAESARGAFRADLLDRLNVLRINVPPLRERREDIHRLATHFAAGRLKRISATALRLLSDYTWPGNVRELRNAIERAIVMGDAETLWPEDLPSGIREGKPGHYHLLTLEGVERDHIIRVLRHTEGNVSRAAKILGIGRVTLHKKVKTYGLELDTFKG